MVDKTNGHIRNQTSAEDAAQQERIAADNMEQLTELRNLIKCTVVRQTQCLNFFHKNVLKLKLRVIQFKC